MALTVFALPAAIPEKAGSYGLANVEAGTGLTVENHSQHFIHPTLLVILKPPGSAVGAAGIHKVAQRYEGRRLGSGRIVASAAWEVCQGGPEGSSSLLGGSG